LRQPRSSRVMDDGRTHDAREGRYVIEPIGVVRSSLKNWKNAPRQGYEGAPDADLEIDRTVMAGLEGLAPGDEILVFTWLHESARDVLRVRPRNDPANPITGVFATRSPDRPNPI